MNNYFLKDCRVFRLNKIILILLIIKKGDSVITELIICIVTISLNKHKHCSVLDAQRTQSLFLVEINQMQLFYSQQCQPDTNNLLHILLPCVNHLPKPSRKPKANQLNISIMKQELYNSSLFLFSISQHTFPTGRSHFYLQHCGKRPFLDIGVSLFHSITTISTLHKVLLILPIHLPKLLLLTDLMNSIFYSMLTGKIFKKQDKIN